jgi:ABC-type phosphate/phosphonate transport system substrate-binding protein
MRIQRLAVIIVCLLVVGLAVAAAPTGAQTAPSPVRIGMLASMFKDVKPAMFHALAKPFYSLVESQTGLKSELLLVPTADELRQQMEAGKIQFGVFHSFEFAWMKQKTPALQPLMIAAPQYRPIRSFLVVHSSSTATGFADLRGKTLALPHGSREYSRLFLERSCAVLGQSPETFFAHITAPKTAEDALHDVADNEAVQAAVVDGSAIQCFTERNPGRAKRIKVIVSSEVFPPSVVAYREGSLDADVIRRFRDGMSHAHTTPLGRQLLSLWLMTGFEPIPADYPKALSDIAKVYPPPGEK